MEVVASNVAAVILMKETGLQFWEERANNREISGYTRKQDFLLVVLLVIANQFKPATHKGKKETIANRESICYNSWQLLPLLPPLGILDHSVTIVENTPPIERWILDGEGFMFVDKLFVV